jgi:hypothetical protein
MNKYPRKSKKKELAAIKTVRNRSVIWDRMDGLNADEWYVEPHDEEVTGV